MVLIQILLILILLAVVFVLGSIAWDIKEIKDLLWEIKGYTKNSGDFVLHMHHSVSDKLRAIMKVFNIKNP